MRKQLSAAVFALFLLLSILLPSAPALAAGTFTDTRFQGNYTTENLDAIIEEYELYNGWYWTTRAGKMQTYHGQQNKPGWTDSAVNQMKKREYKKGWYGCRWNWDKVVAAHPNGGGTGECFGFAQFIGYLLSGYRSPQGKWVAYRDLASSKGLKVGDIIRIDYREKRYHYQHSAIVYSVEGNSVTFLQVSGTNFNELRIGCGYMGGGMEGSTSIKDFREVPGLRIWRSPANVK